MEKKSSKNLFIYLGLAAITLAVFWQVHKFEFTNYDDDKYVSSNPNINSGLKWNNIVWVFTSQHVGNWHPLTGLSHLVDCQLFKLDAGKHHIVNLVFHLSNVLLLFAVLRLMTAKIWQSAFVAALFAIHPLHVESVAWISERKDVLSTMFLLLTMLAYLRYVKSLKISSYMLAIIFFALGLMAKPMLVTLPFLLLLLDYWPLERLKQKNQFINLLKEKIPLFTLSAISCIVTFKVQQSAGAMKDMQALPFIFKANNAIISYLKYIFKMFWPVDLAIFYPYPEKMYSCLQTAGAALILVIVTLLVIKVAAKYKFLFVGWFWFLGTLVPVIGLVQVGQQAMADRYSYIPLIGLFFILTWGANALMEKWKYRNILLGILSIVIISILGFVTYSQVGYWHNSETVFSHAIKATKGNYLAHDYLGVVLTEKGKFVQAAEQFKEAIKIKPDFFTAYHNLATAYGKSGKLQDEIEMYKQALKIKPDLAQTHFTLGMAYGEMGNFKEQIEELNHAIKYDQNYFDAYNRLGIAYAQQGLFEKAIEAFKKAVELNPDSIESHGNLCVSYLSVHDKQSAKKEFEIIKKLDLDKARELINLLKK